MIGMKGWCEKEGITWGFFFFVSFTHVKCANYG